MRWASALSLAADALAAIDEVAGEVEGALEGAPPDLLVVFVSPHHRDRYRDLPRLLLDRLRPKVLLGCSATGVIGAGREVERQAALSVTAGALPDVTLLPFHVEEPDLPSPDAGPGAWAEALAVPLAPRPAGFVILDDPATCDPTRLVEGLDFAWAGAAVVGGLASDGVGNALFLDGRTAPSGAVGVALCGAVTLDPVVAQGCRPIGPELTVTRCRENLLLELGGQRPTEVLREVYQDLDAEARRLFERALHLGVASTGLLGEAQAPEYLIRNVIGADPVSGLLAVGERLRPGQRVRFHLRDAASAREDLAVLLARHAEQRAAPAGALLFACAGRGERFFGRPNHDTQAFDGAFRGVPLGGFFCAGEIGPVGGGTCVLGYTSSFGLFRAPPGAG